MYVPHTVTLALLKVEILVIAALTPHVWKHRFELEIDLQDVKDLDDLGSLLHGLWRMGILLERPGLLLSEYMLSESGMQLRSRIAQQHLCQTVAACAPQTKS